MTHQNYENLQLQEKINHKNEQIQAIKTILGDCSSLILSSFPDPIPKPLETIIKSLSHVRLAIDEIIKFGESRPVKKSHLQLIKTCYKILFSSRVFDISGGSSEELDTSKLKENLHDAIISAEFHTFENYLRHKKRFIVPTPRPFIINLSYVRDYDAAVWKILMSVQELRDHLRELNILELEAWNKNYLPDTRTRNALISIAEDQKKTAVKEKIKASKCYQMEKF